MKNLLAIVLLLPLSVPLFAQSERTTDFGTIAAVELEVSLPANFGLSVEEELRFHHNCVQFDRWLNSLGMDYTCWHNRMNLGLTLDYIRRYNDKDYFENRCRLGLQATYTETYRRFKFQLRSKLLGTFLDETIGEYRMNPRLYWRNRLKATYQPMNSRFKYGLSTELFWLTNDPKGSYVDNIRTVASVEYRLTRRYFLMAFVQMNNELQVKEPVDQFLFGLTFSAKY